MERTLENVHVVIYSKKMLKEAIKRLNNHGQNIETDIMCEYEFHGNDLLIYHDGLFKVIQCLPTHPNHEVTLNDLCEMIIDEESKPKTMEIGKWYTVFDSNWDMPIIAMFRGESSNNTGFNFKGEWCDNIGLHQHELGENMRESTHEEGEKALIFEAKKRGFIKGRTFNNSNIHNQKLLNNSFPLTGYWFRSSENELCLTRSDDESLTYSIFKNGVWAEVIEEEKLKIGDWVFVALENDPQQGFTVFQILEQHTADTHNSDMYKSLYNIKKIDQETAERLRKELV